MNQSWEKDLSRILAEQNRLNLRRRMIDIDRVDGPEVTIDGRSILMFCGNDYLGYSQHPALKEEARRAVDIWGTGVGASRLVSGNPCLYKDLEQTVAHFKHTDDALVFATGYMTNIGVVTSLAQPGDLIISDALNHASLVDACRLTKADIRIVPHADADGFAEELKQHRDQRILMITDGVFSMDGDVAPLGDLVKLAEDFGALLIIDDAHGTGVLGRNGRGSLEELGVNTGYPIQIGTFSKALGSLGGFVAGPSLFIEFLRNRARPLFYSTGLPPATLAVNRRALELVDEEPERRAKLRRNTSRLRQGLENAGLTLIDGPSAIVPVMVGDASRALDMSGELMENGLLCPAIRPPTVPRGQSRLRLTTMATHSESQIDRAVELVTAAAKKTGL